MGMSLPSILPRLVSVMSRIFDAVRAAFPAEKPVIVRLSGTDWVEGGWDIDQTVAFCQALAARGCAAIHVSSGGNSPVQQIPVGPGFQVPLARAVKAAVDIPVIAVGLITGYDVTNPYGG